MYSEKFQESIKAVEAARESNIAYEPARMTAQQKEDLLAAYHPDYKKEEFSTLQIGPNKGDKVPHELAEMLQAHSRITADSVDLTKPDYETDVLIIGGGGAGASAAIEAHEAGADVMIVTKLRIGDANTMMAERLPTRLLWVRRLAISSYLMGCSGTKMTSAPPAIPE